MKDNKTKKRVTLILILLTAAWTAVIFGFSFRSGAASHSESGFVRSALLSITNRFNITINPDIYKIVATFVEDKSHITGEDFVRKTAHFTEYFILGLFFGGAFIRFRKKSKRSFLLLLGGFLVAFIDERLVQQFLVSDRTSSYKDVLLDCIGFYLAAALLLLIYFIARKIRRIRLRARR